MTERIFEDRTAVVTGGGRGIGRAICQMLAERGARVAVNFEHNQQAADETISMIAGQAERAMAVQADVSESAAVDRMMRAVREQLGPIDFLINNAGIATTTSHHDLKYEDWKRMFDINVDGPFLTTWAVKDEMIERQFGRIVNVSSLAGIKIKPDMIHYATTKAALISFTRHCAQAFAPFNVRVNCVAPGLTDTDITRNGNLELVDHLIAVTPMKRMAEPAEIASVVKFLLSDDSSFVTGQTVPACGGRC
ncbi:MAG: glucose 1-dehydrogenase [Planctomycetales bacterium]|jgi:3-oxoacyl-[acyl-carrier protein] reductase|nr:glucose 1-dehydrogenase [Planctomycetales bacterium]|tara:strand:+ start:1338 stop:2087 length:750 start_codon:yes stop_codon:yes gene_type:complete